MTTKRKCGSESEPSSSSGSLPQRYSGYEARKRLNPIVYIKRYVEQKGDEKHKSSSSTRTITRGSESTDLTPRSVLCFDKSKRTPEEKRSPTEKLSNNARVVSSSSNVCECKNSPQIYDPTKAERSAMMKYRFADTILRAKKDLYGGDEFAIKRLEKENLRMKREWLELTTKSRNQRERERAAARVALKKMADSVEIDDNFKTLRDFEALLGFPV